MCSAPHLEKLWRQKVKQSERDTVAELEHKARKETIEISGVNHISIRNLRCYEKEMNNREIIPAKKNLYAFDQYGYIPTMGDKDRAVIMKCPS